MNTLNKPNTAKIKRYPTRMCHMSHKKSQTFKTYGLNIYKNFLVANTFYAYTPDELNKFISEVLLQIITVSDCAAVFVVKQNGKKAIYQIDHDYYFEEGSFVETEPTITVAHISGDINGESFGMFDAEHMYDFYGLIVETKPNIWVVIDK